MEILLVMMSPLRGVTSSMMRAIGLVKGLAQLGHQVDMLTTPEANQLIPMRDGTPLSGEGIRLMETGVNKAYASVVAGNKGALKHLAVKWLRKAFHAVNIYDHTLQIARAVSREGLRDAYDVIISVSDPKTSHIAAQRLMEKGIKAKRWIQYWGDPMTLDITNKSKLPRFLYRRAERKLLADCDKVVYTNPFTLAAQKKLLPEYAAKMDFTPTAVSRELVCVREPDAPFRVSYIGAFNSRVRNILPFYEACQDLEGDFETFIVGNSDHVLQRGKNIRILPRGDAEELERKTDLFICVLNHKGTQIPGKVYHYAASNRPILVILDGDGKNRIQEYLAGFGRYLFCENQSVDIRQAIEKIASEEVVWQSSEQLSPPYIAAGFLKEA